MSKCETLAKQLEKSRSMFGMHLSNSTSDGNRTVTYSRIWVLGIGVRNNCHARVVTEVEKKVFGKDSKEKTSK